MRNFSITPNISQSILEQYTDFLTNDFNYRVKSYDVNDPLFLQQLGILQAESTRRAINTNSAITYAGFQETNETIAEAANFIGNKADSVANILTSSLDKGFCALNYSLANIDSGINTVNANLSNINTGISDVNRNLNVLGGITAQGFSDINRNLNVLGDITAQGFSDVNRNLNVLGGITAQGFSDVNKNLNVLGNVTAQGLSIVNNNLHALRNLVGQGFSTLYTQLGLSNQFLSDILTELKIPETQRQRRYHIEEGAKYLSNALAKGDNLYFDDAFDEFNNAIAIERKDFFSWFNLGVIYLRASNHIDISKAIEAFERFIHYAQAEAMHKNNQNLAYQIDDAYLYLAESHYLQEKFTEAISETEHCALIKDKADFMKVKYLSATNDNTNKQEAANILLQLIEKNPYISLQVLEDEDILNNDFIINMLEEFRKNTVEKASSSWSKTKKYIKNHDLKNIVREIENLLQKQTLLDSYDAINLMENGIKELEELEEKANKLLESKKYNEALECYEALLKLGPNDPDYYSGKADCLYALGEESLTKFSKDPLKNRETNLEKTAEAIKCWDKSMECYDIPIKLDPNNPDCYHRKGLYIFGFGKNEEALKCYDIAIKLEPKFIYYVLKANILNELERYDEVNKCCDFINLKPKFYRNNIDSTLEEVAESLVELKRYDEAIECYDVLIKQDPKEGRYYSDKIKILEKLERYDEIVECYDVLIYLEPDDEYNYSFKADILEKLERYDEAIECYNVVMKLNPDEDVICLQSCYESKIEYLKKLEKYDEALECYDALIKLDPDDYYYVSQRDDFLEEIGKD